MAFLCLKMPGISQDSVVTTVTMVIVCMVGSSVMTCYKFTVESHRMLIPDQNLVMLQPKVL